MRFLEAQHLFAQIGDIGAERIERRRCHVPAVVNRVDRAERVLRRENVIHARGAEILSNGLQRAGEQFRDAAGFPFGNVSSGPFGAATSSSSCGTTAAHAALCAAVHEDPSGTRVPLRASAAGTNVSEV